MAKNNKPNNPISNILIIGIVVSTIIAGYTIYLSIVTIEKHDIKGWSILIMCVMAAIFSVGFTLHLEKLHKISNLQKKIETLYENDNRRIKYPQVLSFLSKEDRDELSKLIDEITAQFEYEFVRYPAQEKILSLWIKWKLEDIRDKIKSNEIDTHENQLNFSLLANKKRYRDRNIEAWRTFHNMAQRKIIGIQYYVSDSANGASSDQNRIEIISETIKRIKPVISFYPCYVRYFIIDDTQLDLLESTLGNIYDSMKAQKNLGVSIKYILQTNFQLINQGQLSTKFGSDDICFIDDSCVLGVVYQKTSSLDNNQKTVEKIKYTVKVHRDLIDQTARLIKEIDKSPYLKEFDETKVEREEFIKEITDIVKRTIPNDLSKPNNNMERILDAQRFEFSVGNETISAIKYYNKSKSEPSIIFLHGGGKANKERITYLAKELSDNGMSSLTFDFSGHGESTDNSISSLSKRVEQAKFALNFLDKPNTKIKIIASSMGAFIALRLLDNVNIDSLILFSPALYSDECIDKPLDENWKNFTKDGYLNATRTLDCLSEYRGKLLILNAEKDAVVLPEWKVPQRLIDSAKNIIPENKKCIEIKNAPHLLHQWFNDIENIENQKYFKESILPEILHFSA